MSRRHPETPSRAAQLLELLRAQGPQTIKDAAVALDLEYTDLLACSRYARQRLGVSYLTQGRKAGVLCLDGQQEQAQARLKLAVAQREQRRSLTSRQRSEASRAAILRRLEQGPAKRDELITAARLERGRVLSLLEHLVSAGVVSRSRTSSAEPAVYCLARPVQNMSPSAPAPASASAVVSLQLSEQSLELLRRIQAGDRVQPSGLLKVLLRRGLAVAEGRGWRLTQRGQAALREVR